MDDLNENISRAVRAVISQDSKISNEVEWILDHLEDSSLYKEVASLSILGFHILSALLEEELTGNELANLLGSTRGGVTRAAQSLLNYQMVECHQLEENKKKKYYRLTEKGKKVAKVHTEMRVKADAYRKKELYDHFTDEEKQIILRFLQESLRVQEEILKEE